MLVVTSNDIPGWEIRQVCGEVFGLTVRSRNAFSQMGAGFKSLVGGELKGMTANLVNSRNEVMGRMIDEARLRGANAVVTMRFDTSEMGDTWTELCAYGTAVVAVPVTDAAKQTAQRLGYGPPATQQPAQPQPQQQDPYGGGEPLQQGQQPVQQQAQADGQPFVMPPSYQPVYHEPGEPS
jgi:uncharacterized protein YbjQ (UPF0145 family)